MPARKTAVVVGGGISGLLSALLLKKKYSTVYIIEKEARCGGLMDSFQDKQGVWFDYGTHFLRDTGIPELDTLLFDGIVTHEKWYAFPALKIGNYFQGQLNSQTQFPDIRFLPTHLYRQGLVELLSQTDQKLQRANLKEHLQKTFGELLTENLFAPSLRKFFGKELHELAPGAHTLFGLGRVIALTPQATRELKRSPIYDEKFAFHSTAEGASGKQSYYPKEGGIGAYPAALARKLQHAGVHILCQESVANVNHQNWAVSGVRTQSGKQLACDLLLWTVPLFLFAKAAQISFPQSTKSPELRTTTLHHMNFDAPFQTDVFYLTCFDPDLSLFRVTLYPNIGSKPKKTPPYNCTVEVLSSPITQPKELLSELAKELVVMGVVAPSARILSQQSMHVGQGFPILTNSFVEQSQGQLAFLQQQFKNVVFLGKVNTSSFFMDDVLRDTWHALQQLD